MKKRDVVKNIELFRDLRVGGEPSATWIRDTRASLLARVSEQRVAVRPAKAVTTKSLLIDVLFDVPRSLRTSGAFVAALLVMFTGWVGGVAAAYNTVPGDTLYPLKRVSERAQLALATDQDARARLQVEFVGRRVSEITKIVEAPAVRGDEDRLEEAVSQLRSNMRGVEVSLATLRQHSPSAAVRVAQLVGQKADEYHAVLVHAAPPVLGSESAVQEAKNIVVDASVKAVAVIIEEHANGAGTVSEKEVATTVGEKIQAVSDRVDSLVEASTDVVPHSAQESATQAKVALSEAKSLIAKQDLSGALVKVIEGKELVKAAERITVAAIEATNALPFGVGASGTTGVVSVGVSDSSFPTTVSSTTPAVIEDPLPSSSSVPTSIIVP
jgi:hypothetical protein